MCNDSVEQYENSLHNSVVLYISKHKVKHIFSEVLINTVVLNEYSLHNSVAPQINTVVQNENSLHNSVVPQRQEHRCGGLGL